MNKVVGGAFVLGEEQVGSALFLDRAKGRGLRAMALFHGNGEAE